MLSKRLVSLRSLRNRSLLYYHLLIMRSFHTLFTLFAYCTNHLPQPVPGKDEKATVPPISVGSNTIDLPSEGQNQAGTSNIDGDHNSAYPNNFYASQAQPFYYQGQLPYMPVFILCKMFCIASPFFVY